MPQFVRMKKTAQNQHGRLLRDHTYPLKGGIPKGMKVSDLLAGGACEVIDGHGRIVREAAKPESVSFTGPEKSEEEDNRDPDSAYEDEEGGDE